MLSIRAYVRNAAASVKAIGTRMLVSSWEQSMPYVLIRHAQQAAWEPVPQCP